VAKEEAGFIAAHVAVGDRVAVDDLPLVHVLAHFARFLLVDEGGEAPVLAVDLAVPRAAGGERRGDFDKGVVEVGVVEEDPVVVVGVVEAVLDLADGAGDLPDVAVAGEGYEGRVHAGAGGGLA